MQTEVNLESLLMKWCPNGVKYFWIGELEDSKKISLGRGKVISKKEIADNPGSYPVYSSSATGDGEIGRYGQYMFDDIRLSWSIDGGGKFFYRDAPKYSITNVSGWLEVVDKNFIEIKYLYYAMTNEWVKKSYDYTHKAHPSVIRKEYRIPLPPLPVQQEIVRILDHFTELTAELTAEQTAELTARRKQYAYYRDALLTFGGEVEYKSIMEIAPPRRGVRVVRNQLEKTGKFPVFQNSIVPLGFYEKSNCGANKTFIITAGAAGEVGYSSTAFWAADDCYYFDCTDKILDRFLYFVLTSKKTYLSGQIRKASIPRLGRNSIEKLVIGIPPLAKQREIVSILDRFDAFCNDLTSGLPAEIKARKQQYEYYRNKLLSFQEAKDDV